MSQHHKRMTGSARQKRNAKLLAEKGTVCHVCGHPDAEAIDHDVALARGGSDTDPDNLKPIHHKPCPTCSEPCNLRKGTRALAPIIRRSNTLQRP